MPFEDVDIFRAPLSVDQIKALAGAHPIGELFSWKSPQAKARGLRPGAAADAALLELMASEPRLIRRPLVRVGGELIVGADLDRLRELLSETTAEH